MPANGFVSMQFLRGHPTTLCQWDADDGTVTNDLTFNSLFETWSQQYNIEETVHAVEISMNFGTHFVRETGMSLFHCLPITLGRLPARWLFPGDTPKPVTVKRFRAAQPAPTAEPKELKPKGKMTAERILEWVDVSRDLRNYKYVRNARTKWKRIIVKDDTPAQFLHNDQGGADSLRQARVHLDMSAMLAFRHYWRTLEIADLWVFLFLDASPQRRGLELFAATFDLYRHLNGEDIFARRLFPMINIGRNLYSLHGKVVATLWIIFLQVGPNYHDIRNFCNRICCITTDMGTEMNIADYRDILLQFCKTLRIPTPRGEICQQYLFPNALMSVGWMHHAPLIRDSTFCKRVLFYVVSMYEVFDLICQC